jgi:sugar phosphate isomerase/epimerase
MINLIKRRKFLKSFVGTSALAYSGMHLSAAFPAKSFPGAAKGLKTSLNAFSFNAALTNGTMTLSDMLEFCANRGFDGVDITGYYFKGFPQPPSDEDIFEIKRKAFGLELEISGTGIRNDFTIADVIRREQEVKLVKSWIEAAAKLGAPVLRIFAGNQKNEGIPNKEVTSWMLNDIQTCVDYGKRHGVIIGLQNHNDFIQTASQVIEIIETIRSI